MARARLPVVLAGCLLASTASAAPQASRTVYVSAFDSKNAPVPDLSVADVTIKEDGKVREVTRVEPAKAPMSIVLMLDDGGLELGAIRQGAGQFVEALQGKAEFSLVALGANNVTLVDFTPDPRTLYGALQKMLPRNSPPTRVLEALVEATEKLQQRAALRPAVVIVASEVDDFSSVRPDVVLGTIQKIGARVYYIGLGGPKTQGNKPTYAAQRPGDSTEDEAVRKNAVLGAAPKNSGGRSEHALQPSGIVGTMKQFASELGSQYAVTYTTDTSDAKLSVETKRKGVKLRAPARVGK